MKWVAVVTTFLTLAALPAAAQDMQLPFEGRWFVMQGGDTPNVNQHMTHPAQAFGVDFAKIGGVGQRQLAAGTPTTTEDSYSWGTAVLAPCDGEVVAVVADRPDNRLETTDPQHPAGNHVVIRAAEKCFVFLAHLQRGSVLVAPGDEVRRGQRRGRCGNLGNSDFPHIDIHVQDTAVLNEGHGQNMIFGPIDVELTGKKFLGVHWPLIRGLFVSNP